MASPDHVNDEERALHIARTNSDVSADDTIAPAPFAELAEEGLAPLTGVSAQCTCSDEDLSAVTVSPSDYLRMPY